MVADPAAVEAVVLGADLRAGTTLVEMSTIGPDAVRSQAARLPAGVDVLDAPVLGSIPQATKRPLIESGVYTPNFTLGLAAKDLRLVTEAAQSAGVKLRVAAAALSWLERAGAHGLGDLDYSAVIADVRGRPAS